MRGRDSEVERLLPDSHWPFFTIERKKRARIFYDQRGLHF